MLQVSVFNAHPRHRVAVGRSAAYVRRVLRLAGVKNARVSVVMVSSRYCRKINKVYLHHDSVTDVISFPLETGRVLEGEIYVNVDRARVQARQYGVSFGNELARLILHGTLHLVGYDDTAGRKRIIMRQEEDRHMRFWFEQARG